MLLFHYNDQPSLTSPGDTLIDIIPADIARTLPGLLMERARRSPDGTAYLRWDTELADWLPLSWHDITTQVGRWQSALAREGLGAGDRVAIMSRNRIEWVLFDQAALGLGLVTVPLYPDDRPENIRHVLDDAGVKLMLVEHAEQLIGLRPIADRLAALERLLIVERGAGELADAANTREFDAWLGDAQGPMQARGDDPEALATIVYTSGTTGPPKGVMLSHRNMLWDAEAAMKLVPATLADRFLSFLPLSHMLERTAGYLLPIMAGSAVAHARSIPQLAEDLAAVRPTVMISVPRIYERVHTKLRDKLAAGPALSRRLFENAVAIGWQRFEHQQGRGPTPGVLANLLWPLLDRLVGAKVRGRLGGQLRIAVCGGAPLSPDVAKVFLGLGVPVVQGYGLTETSPVISVNRVENNKPASVGEALPGLQLRIGQADELLLRGPITSAGYWNDPRATALLLDEDGWLHTGDQARIDADGHLFITGRLKDVIVMANGEKVSPSDMEIAIATDPLIEQVMIIGEQKPYLTALITLDQEAYDQLAREHGLNPDLAAERHEARLQELLRERIAGHLSAFPGYARIHRIAVADEPWSIEGGLITPTMKVKRKAVMERFSDEIDGLYVGHS